LVPLLAVPLAFVGLGAGLPLLFGALMRPLGAALSAAAGALALIGYDLTVGDGTFSNGLPFSALPYSGARLYTVPTTLGIEELLQRGQLILQDYPQLLLLVVLWAAMALVVSLGEWTGRPFAGLALAVAGGVLAYALVISERSQALTDAVISLGLAAIICAVLRYLVTRARG
jgi:hypothetical protein